MADGTMRVNVTLDTDGIEDLVKVLATMPEKKNAQGVPLGTDAADALRYALKAVASGKGLSEVILKQRGARR